MCGRSLQLTVSPCWEQHLPDVISANPSSDAWTPTPVVPTVHMLVSSRRASAFPELKAGRHSTTFRTATSVRGSLRGCSHSLMFRPPSLLALQIAPTAEVLTPSGQPGLFHSSNTRLVTSSCVEYANRSNRATNGARTCTSQNSQPCRLLLYPRPNGERGRRGGASNRRSRAPRWVAVKRAHANHLPIGSVATRQFKCVRARAGFYPAQPYKATPAGNPPLASDWEADLLYSVVSPPS